MMSRVIQLTRGHVATVDDEDCERLAAVKWCAQPSGNAVYATRCIRTPDGARRRLPMANAILGLDPGRIVDHINGDALDNRKDNLRSATTIENGRNRGPQRDNKSGFKGVAWERGNRRWRARIKDGRLIHLGYFADAGDAARAYDRAARQHFGEFAWTNFKEEEKER